MPDEQLTPEEMQLLKDLTGANAPLPEDKHNTHTFLHKISVSKDTTKTGNLDTVEIGTTPYALRTYKRLYLISEELVQDDIWAEFFKDEGEILTATSLSKGGFLTGLAVVQKRQIEDITQQPPKENKAWFKKREPQQPVIQQ